MGPLRIGVESSLEVLSRKYAHLDLKCFGLRFAKYCVVCLGFALMSGADTLVSTEVQVPLECLALEMKMFHARFSSFTGVALTMIRTSYLAGYL